MKLRCKIFMVYSEGLKVHVKSNSNDFCAFEHYIISLLEQHG